MEEIKLVLLRAFFSSWHLKSKYKLNYIWTLYFPGKRTSKCKHKQSRKLVISPKTNQNGETIQIIVNLTLFRILYFSGQLGL